MNGEKINLAVLFERLRKGAFELGTADLQKLVIEALLNFKSELLENKKAYSSEELNRLYAVSIFFRAYLDYLALVEITADDKWLTDFKTLDSVWILMWDCKERLESYPNIVRGHVVKEIQGLLQKLFNVYDSSFGPGIYMSPDLKVKKRLCSICNENIKKCAHTPGKLYDGQMCRQIMADFEMLSVSAVKYPEDHRCRIWPWNVKDDNTASAAFLTYFLIDDFLQDNDWLKHYMGKKSTIGLIQGENPAV